MTVYFARTGDEVKVGYTAKDDPFDRQGGLQTEKVRRVEIIGYVPGPRELEGDFLDALSAYRTQGEWHHAVPAVLAYVRDVLKSTQAGVIVTLEALETGYDPDATFARLMRAAGEEPPAIAPSTLEDEPEDDAPSVVLETALVLPAGPRWDGDDAPGIPAERTQLVETPDPATLAKTAPEVVERAEALAEKPMSESTRKNYSRAWKQWCAWCDVHKQQKMPADERAIRVFLTQLAGAGRGLATLQLTYYAIRACHKKYEQPLGPLPKVSALFANLERERANRREKPWRGKDSLRAETLRAGLLAHEPQTIREIRDRAVLLVGFMAALRRSELVVLDVSDFEFSPDGGVNLTIRKGKADQKGKGVVVPIAKANEPKLCPALAMRAWLDAAKVKDGPAFRRLHNVIGKDYVTRSPMSEATVSSIVKQFVAAQGMDRREFGAHSLRAGFITEAANEGVPMHDIMATSRHKDEKTARGYIRNIDPGKRAIKLF